MIDAAADVLVRARPPGARLAQPPVLDVPCGDAVGLQRIGHRTELGQPGVVGPEAPAVDQHDHRMRAGPGGDP
nr:hypothetical protein [Phenylobacterium sp.]